jgi:hypothetical protein
MAIHVVIHEVKDPRLKRFVEHDDRSRAFAFEETTEDRTIFWDDAAPILDQKQVGGCVGFTGADLFNTAMFAPLRKAKNGGQFFNNKDGMFFYSQATKNDNVKGVYPPDDTGSSGLGLAKALKKLGDCDGYKHCFSWNSYLNAIQTQPVAVGTLWTNSMFNPDHNGVLHVGALTDSNIAGGHEYMIRGRNADTHLNLMRNHWNASWSPSKNGPKVPGEAWITDDDLKLLLKNQGDVTVIHGSGLP